LSDNVYWQSQTRADLQRLNELKAQTVEMTARGREAGADMLVTVRLINSGNAPILNAKITMLDEAGRRVLPVYYSDNYITLLPGEARELDIRCPPGTSPCSRVALRGWNIVQREVAITPSHAQ
jgi:hypothetical protein